MEKEKINITAIQTCAAIGNKQKNYEHIYRLISEIKETDVVVLPEVWSIGWDCSIFRKNAETFTNSETINFLSKIAKEKNVHIIGGSFITKNKEIYYNTCPIINNNGKLIAVYNKTHLYSYYGSNEGKIVTSGNEPLIVNIDGIKFGITICYDIRFPELYRAYRKAGADIFVNCAAWASTKPIPWEMMTKSRAIENQTYMIATNQFGKIKNNEYNLGHSRIINYNGNVISEILNKEGCINATLNIKEMYEFREECTILNDIKKSYEVKVL